MAGIRNWAAMVLVAFTAMGCATMTVSSHVEHGLDVTRYHTYDWGPADALPTGDPRLDENPFFKDHVMGAVEKQMARKGLNRSGINEKADLLVHYHAVISPRIDVNRIDQELHGYCYDEDCRARVLEDEAGTLVLDIVDARTNRVIWRGWAQDTIAGALENEDKMAKQIDQAVTRMLARFPRPL